jgi:hypothetical protein
MTTLPPGYAIDPRTPGAPAETPIATPAAATTTVPHVKFSLNAKGLLQYELTLCYATVDDLMRRAIDDARGFDTAARAVFANIVPAAKSGTTAD